MFEIDIRTLFIVCGFIAFGMFISLFGLRRSLHSSPGTGYWVLSMLAITLGVFLLALRSFLPDFLTIICANLLLLLGFIMMFWGLQEFTSSNSSRSIEVFMFLVVLFGMIFFTYGRQSVGARVILMSLSMSIISLRFIVYIFSNRNARWRSAGLALGSVFLIYGMAMFARIPVEITGDMNLPFMDHGGWAALLILALVFVIVGSTTTLILLALKTIESERIILSQAATQSAASIIITDTKGSITYVNPAFTEKTGYSLEEVIGKNPNILRPDDEQALNFKELWETILAGQTWHGEFKNKKKSGELFWEIGSIAPVKQLDGTTSHFVAVKEDCTALKEAEHKIRYLAHHDPLTGLASRTLASDRLINATARSRRSQTMTAILYLDIDGFKPINDTWGHDAGDQVLVQVAASLTSCVREVDTVARIGGDEFAVFLTEINSENEVVKIANKLVKAISQLKLSVDAKIGVSIGISLHPLHGDSYEELLRKADQAMYEVKKNGKNNFRFFQTENTNK